MNDLSALSRGAFALSDDCKIRSVMQKLRVFEWAAREISRRRYEKYARLAYTAGALRVGEHAYPQLLAMLKEVCAAFDLPAPELYVRPGEAPQAQLLGEEKPMLILSTGMLALLSKDEMRVLFAHQIAHLHCGHEPFLMARELLASAADNMGIFKGMVAPLRALLEEWAALAALSCDRGALLATGDLASLHSLLTKLAGGSCALYGGAGAQALLEQYNTYGCIKGDTPACPLFKTWSSLYLSLPHHVLRAGEIQKWSQSPEYAALSRGEQPAAACGAPEVDDEQAQACWGAFAGEESPWTSTPLSDEVIFGLGSLKAGAQRLAGEAEGALKSGAELAGKTLSSVADALFKFSGKA